MRFTIHVTSERDYPLLAAGTRRARQESWLRVNGMEARDLDMEAMAAVVRRELALGARRRDELVELLRPHDPSGRGLAWNGVGAWIDLVRVPPAGTWERRRADLYATADDWLGPAHATEDEGLERLLRRYLGGFGPARLAEAADWVGVPVKSFQQVAERLSLRRFRAEDGAELLDLPRAPLPGSDARMPVRFLPTWDATLLAHARRTQILPERFRPLVFHTKNPHSVPTFVVDGAVAGKWRVERTGTMATLVVEPFEPIPPAAHAALREEGAGLVRFMEPDALAYKVTT